MNFDSSESFDDLNHYMSYGTDPLYQSENTEIVASYPGYNIISLIGKGFFGEVWKAERLSDGEIIALKVVNTDPLNPKMLQALKREAKILNKISRPQCQPFLVCFNDYKYLPDQNKFIIDMTLIEGKTLVKYAIILDEETRYKHLLLIMKDIIKALEYLHNNGIIHNDVKPENIIIDKHLTPILVDFGVACVDLSVCKLDKNVTSKCCKGIMGPNMYISPETIKRKVYYIESDIWSLGITFYIAATGKYPFNKGNNLEELFNNIKNDEPDKLNTSNEVLNYIVNRALDKNPVTRITIPEISKILSEL